MADCPQVRAYSSDDERQQALIQEYGQDDPVPLTLTGAFADCIAPTTTNF